MAAVVRAEGVVKRWGSTTALDGVTVEIGPGITGLLGANGAGKTTFLSLVLGLHRPDSGRLEVLGRDPWRLGPEVRARIGYAPEHHNLPPDVRAHDLVRHLAEVHGVPHQDAIGRAGDTLALVGLGEERFRPIGTMSTGQRQRVKLAQALAHGPGLVLLDEPTDGLDPVQRDHMLGLIRRVGADLGIDVVLSSHLLDEVERVCDAAVILTDGTLTRSGSLSDLTGEGRGLLVELDDDPAPVVAAVEQQGASVVSIDGRRLVIDGADDDVLDAVRDAGALHGLGLRRLERRTATLQDLFVGEGAGEVAPR